MRTAAPFQSGTLLRLPIESTSVTAGAAGKVVDLSSDQVSQRGLATPRLAVRGMLGLSRRMEPSCTAGIWTVKPLEPSCFIVMATRGNVTNRADVVRDLYHRHNVSVLVFDYRGFGRSDGKPDEKGILADARAARDWLARRARIPVDQTLLMGRSLGGGVAVDLAAKDGAIGLVLMSTFSSLPDMGARFVPWMKPHRSMTQRLDSLSKMDRYTGPLLQSHGDRDRLIPIQQGRRLHEAAHGPKRFVTIEGGDHNAPWSGRVSSRV